MSAEEQLYCPIRKIWIAALPEEYVRQRILSSMVRELGFPASLLAVEKAIRQLPHLVVSDTRHVPDRRADIICFAKNDQNHLFPLLAIECKAVNLTSKVINQVVGYNHYIRASFIAIANQHQICTGWYDQAKKEYVFVDHLPSYADLCSSLGTR